MKKVILTVLLVVSFACKNNKKQNDNNVSPTEKTLTKLILPNYPLWIFNRLSFEQDSSTLSINNEDVFKIARTSIEKSAYAIVKEIPIIHGLKYRLSILVKKGDIGNLFGLRIMGQYPNRIDAVFDLEKGIVKESLSTGIFLDGNATIEALENGWYKCSITTVLEEDLVGIILGPTTNIRKAITWEASSEELNNNYIIPSSLKMEEIPN